MNQTFESLELCSKELAHLRPIPPKNSAKYGEGYGEGMFHHTFV